jgi:hypothetical protein
MAACLMRHMWLEGAVLHPQNPVEIPGCKIRLVQGTQQRHAPVTRDRGQQVENAGTGGGVERGNRLVCQQQTRPCTTARAIATRCCSPPESARVGARSLWPRPTACRAASASFSSCRRGQAR